ncbi:MAG: HEAT repeat domain-containing protein [Bradymonadia bacterium]
MSRSRPTSFRRALLLPALLVGGLAAALAFEPTPFADPTTGPDEARRAHERLELRGLYALALDAHQSADHGEQGLGLLESALTFEGEVTLTPEGPGRLALTLQAARRVEGRFGGGGLRGLDAVFEGAVGQVVIARYDAQGVFTGLEVPPGVGEAAQGLYQALAGVLQRTPEGVSEATVLARMDATWSVTPQGDLERARSAASDPAPRHPGATQVELPTSSTRFGLDTVGRVVSVSHEERTRLLNDTHTERVNDHLSLTLRRLGDAPISVADLDATRRTVGVGEVAPDGLAEAELLRAAAAGLDRETLVRLVRLHGAAGRMPDLSRFLYRAAALLRLDPEAAAALAATYDELPSAAPGRGLVLDLLSQVGTDGTQRALVEVLSSATAVADPLYEVHVQRMGFVPDPSPALVDFARELAAHPPAGTEKAAAFGLGAVAGQVARQGREADAVALVEPLREALEHAETPEARADALRALGNAGLASDFETLAAHADADEPGVRAAVGSALRKLDTPQARSLLVTLAGDADRDVALSAFQSLTGLELGSTELDALIGVAGSAHLAEAVAGAMVNTAARYRERPEGRLLLVTLAARPDLSPALRARLEALGG